MNGEAWVKHKWGDIRRTGHKMNVVVAMIAASQKKESICSNYNRQRFYLSTSVVELLF